MVVIKANSTRIWDVGDMEYTIIAEFLDELPMEQLAEIEVASPVSDHISWWYEQDAMMCRLRYIRRVLVALAPPAWAVPRRLPGFKRDI